MLLNKLLGIGVTKYSEDEQVIGTWIDGKPLYLKTINFGGLTNKTEKKVAHNISNLKWVVDFYGTARRSEDPYDWEPLSFPHINSIVSQWTFYVTPQYIVFNCGSGENRSNFTQCYVIILYTKTTD